MMGISKRMRLAENCETSKEKLNKLSFDKNWKVRYAIATNPNTSEVIRSRLEEEGAIKK